MCIPCGILNTDKRIQTANLSGRVAVVTGGRIKIGYEIVLKLLRAGAAVTATSRFVNNAWVRFSKETDFAEWKHRLHIDPLNLLNLASLDAFVELLKKRYTTVDILINNAAQTLARDADFYRHEISQDSQQLLMLCADAPVHALPAPDTPDASATALVKATDEKRVAVDEYGQPATASKSWVERLENVATKELAEVTIINQLAPTLLIQKLQPLMVKKEPDIAFIANVTAMEGVFNKIHKTCGHPHTNMAKAALMMVTRTSAYDFWKRYRINMYSPDTGFIDQMAPSDKTVVLPLDVVDGAARVLDRIFMQALNPTAKMNIGGWEKDYRLMDKW